MVIPLTTLLLTTEKTKILLCNDGLGLVGSAEQGFLQLVLDDKLEDRYATYMSDGPCFRPLDEGRSPYHHGYFYKLELFCLDCEDRWAPFLETAREFFQAHTDKKVKTVRTEEGFDLEIDGIEVGSYGRRMVGPLDWSYGTGLALPRFSQVVG